MFPSIFVLRNLFNDGAFADNLRPATPLLLCCLSLLLPQPNLPHRFTSFRVQPKTWKVVSKYFSGTWNSKLYLCLSIDMSGGDFAGVCCVSSICVAIFNPLNTKRRLLYLKTQFVPRSKHFSSRL